MPNKSSNQESGYNSSPKTDHIEKKITPHVRVFETSVHKSEAWIKEIQSELSWVSGDKTYHLLRAVLHALRDHFSLDEGAHFSAQLPLVLRGTFYECWNPKENQSAPATKEDFLKAVQAGFGLSDRINYDFEKGVVVVLGVIMNHITPGEMDDVIQSSKHSLRTFLKTIEEFNFGVKYQ